METGVSGAAEYMRKEKNSAGVTGGAARGQIPEAQNPVKIFKSYLNRSDKFWAADCSDQTYISEDKSDYPKENRLKRDKGWWGETRLEASAMT